MITQETDILIIGGGIAGCIAAISLSDSYKVSIIDKLKEPNEKIGESLAPAAQRILKELNLLEGLNSKENEVFIQNLGMQSYWGSERVQVNDYLRNPDGFSRNLNRKAFELYLRKVAEQRKVSCFWGCKLFSSSNKNKKWNILAKSYQEEYTFSAKLVIDASGRQAHFARSIGIKREAIDKLMACWVSLPNREENTMSTIAASENGWWYSAVVPNNKRVISFQTDSDLIDRAVFKNLDLFLNLAKENETIYSLLESCKDAIKLRGTVSANSTRLNQVIGQQWVAIGDAAISFDPLSSQGIFNAMASAMQLRKLLTQHDVIKNSSNENMYRLSIDYQTQINTVWEHYLMHKNLFYTMEQRWKDAPFWERRL